MKSHLYWTESCLASQLEFTCRRMLSDSPNRRNCGCNCVALFILLYFFFFYGRGPKGPLKRLMGNTQCSAVTRCLNGASDVIAHWCLWFVSRNTTRSLLCKPAAQNLESHILQELKVCKT